MELKGLKLHRADGTVDTYDFPITKIYTDTDGSTGSGGATGDAGSANRLYVYRSGDADFVNCSYSLGGNITMEQPPFTAPGFLGSAGEEVIDHIRVRYLSDDASPSGYGYFNLALNTTFADYNKLCIDACHVNKYSEADTNIIDMRCGFFNKDVDPDNGDMVYDTGYVYEKVNRGRKTYEFDISECVVSKTVSFLLVDAYPLCVYNIWLEK